MCSRFNHIIYLHLHFSLFFVFYLCFPCTSIDSVHIGQDRLSTFIIFVTLFCVWKFASIEALFFFSAVNCHTWHFFSHLICNPTYLHDVCVFVYCLIVCLFYHSLHFFFFFLAHSMLVFSIMYRSHNLWKHNTFTYINIYIVYIHKYIYTYVYIYSIYIVDVPIKNKITSMATESRCGRRTGCKFITQKRSTKKLKSKKKNNGETENEQGCEIHAK